MTFEPVLYLNADEYDARLDRFLIDLFFTEGLLDAANTGSVTQRAAAPNLSVDVDAFAAVIDGDDIENQGAYLVRLVEGENVVTDGPPASGTRLDLLVVEVLDADSVALGGRPEGPRLRVVNGTATSGTPVLPPTPPTALPLASWPVTATTTAILDADITRYRVQSSQVPQFNVDLQPVADATWRQYVAQALAALTPATQVGVDAVRAATSTGLGQVSAAVGTVLADVNEALSEAQQPYSLPTRTAAFMFLGS